MKELAPVVIILLIVGGLNWGLIGLFNYNLVNSLLGGVPVLEKAVYILVGLAALAKAYWKYMGGKK